MDEQTITAATIVRFSTELEARSAAFYEQLAERFPALRTQFAGFARDCEKNSAQVMRTYKETVTDALETGFSFAGLNLQGYEIDVTVPEGIDLARAVGKALALEANAVAFYEDVAERSSSLLATIPRAFRRVARIHARNREALALLAGG